MIRRLKIKNRINKALKPVVFAVAGLGMLFNVGMNTGCKTADINNHDPQEYYLTVHLQDVFTRNNIVGGEVVVNNIAGYNTDSFKIHGNVVNTIEVKGVKGYNHTYILGVVGGGGKEDKNIVFARDKNGTFKQYGMESNIIMYAKLVPNTFDTVEFAKSIGNGVALNTGDGTVQNYQKTNIRVGIVKSTEKNGMDPTPTTISNLKSAIQEINEEAGGIIVLDYAGQVVVNDGVTHYVKNASPGHGETLNDDNVIIKSGLGTHPDVTEDLILIELCQAASGLRQDGGDNNFNYYSSGAWHVNAGKAMYLVNFAPPGFQLSNNNPDPAASKNIMVFTTVAEQEYKNAMKENSYVKPFGVNRMPDDYNGSGRFHHKKHHRK